MKWNKAKKTPISSTDEKSALLLKLERAINDFEDGNNENARKAFEELTEDGLVKDDLIKDTANYYLGFMYEFKLTGEEIELQESRAKAKDYYNASYREGEGNISAGIGLAKFSKADEAGRIYNNISQLESDDKTIKDLTNYATYKLLKIGFSKIEMLPVESDKGTTLSQAITDCLAKIEEIRAQYPRPEQRAYFFKKLQIIEARYLFLQGVEGQEQAIKIFEKNEKSLNTEAKRIYAELLFRRDQTFNTFFLLDPKDKQEISANDLHKFERALNKSIELDPTIPEYYLAMARLYWRKYTDGASTNIELLHKSQENLRKGFELADSDSEKFAIALEDLNQLKLIENQVVSSKILEFLKVKFESEIRPKIAKSGLLLNRWQKPNNRVAKNIRTEFLELIQQTLKVPEAQDALYKLSLTKDVKLEEISTGIFNKILDSKVHSDSCSSNVAFKDFISRKYCIVNGKLTRESGTRVDFEEAKDAIQIRHLISYKIEQGNQGADIDEVTSIIKHSIKTAVPAVLQEIENEAAKKRAEAHAGEMLRDQTIGRGTGTAEAKLEIFKQNFVTQFLEEYHRALLISDPKRPLDPAVEDGLVTGLMGKFGYVLPLLTPVMTTMGAVAAHTMTQFVGITGRGFVRDQKIQAMRACSHDFAMIGDRNPQRAEDLAKEFAHELMEKYYLQITSMENGEDVKKMAETALTNIATGAASRVTVASNSLRKVRNFIRGKFYGQYNIGNSKLSDIESLILLRDSFEEGTKYTEINGQQRSDIQPIYPLVSSDSGEFGRGWNTAEVFTKPGIYSNGKYYSKDGTTDAARYGYMHSTPADGFKLERESEGGVARSLSENTFKGPEFATIMQKFKTSFGVKARDKVREGQTVEGIKEKKQEVKLGIRRNRLLSNFGFAVLSGLSTVVLGISLAVIALPVAAVTMVGMATAFTVMFCSNQVRKITKGNNELKKLSVQKHVIEEENKKAGVANILLNRPETSARPLDPVESHYRDKLKKQRMHAQNIPKEV